MKLFKKILVVLAVIIVIAQFIRPSRENPLFDESKTLRAATQVPPDVATILDRSCNDCHSSQTDWPWYSNISPVSWYLVKHVNDGRKELSFSEWGSYSKKKAARKLKEIYEQISQGEMPFESYLLLHPSAKLSDTDKQLLCDWANQERQKLMENQTPSTR